MSLSAIRGKQLPPLTADVRLAEAVSLFEKDLTMEQKAEFRALRLDAEHKGPVEADVYRFTARFNRSLLTHRSDDTRAYGTRLTNILQAVQQYTALGDNMIGLTANPIARAVWTTVRFSLQVCLPSIKY